MQISEAVKLTFVNAALNYTRRHHS